MNQNGTTWNACIVLLAATLLSLGAGAQGNPTSVSNGTACGGPAATQNPQCAAFTWKVSGECMVDFDATASGPGGARFDWAFGDGGTASGAHVSHRFPYAGAFQVSLTTSRERGPDGKSTQTVRIPSEGIGSRGDPDPHRHLQWGLDSIRAQDAWAFSSGRCVVIAVPDSGVDSTHPDLQGQLLPQVDFVTEAQSRDPCDAHGTQMIGIAVAATHNGIGISGVAPNAKVLPLRTTCGDTSVQKGVGRLAAALRYAADHGARVASISLVYDIEQVTQNESWGDLLLAVDYAYGRGMTLVAAAANFGLPLCDYPASDPKVICVGGLTREDQRTSYSNYDALGSSHVMAPAGEAPFAFQRQKLDPHACEPLILSTAPHYMRLFECEPQGYMYGAGTSAATPHVAGIAALLVAQGLGNDEIVRRIKCTADDLGLPGRDPIYGWGRVNALRAVTNDRNAAESGC